MDFTLPALLPTALLPAALLADRLLAEPPARLHPVCLMGRLATYLEGRLRRGPNTRTMFFSGLCAALLVALPFAAAAFLLVWAALRYGGDCAAWLVCASLVYLCLAPRCLSDSALEIARLLARNDLQGARRALAGIVGRDTSGLDCHGVARACVESVAENLTDAVLSTLFWAGAGLLLFGYPAAAGLAVLHRCMNMLDALWGKKNEKYIRFGTFAALFDDALNFVPARLSLPVIALAAGFCPKLSAKNSLRTGWKYRRAHESPNSAWSEAAFAGALGLKLGGPALYGTQRIAHPWLGDGTPDATPEHIFSASRLMYSSVIVFTILEICSIGLLSWADCPFL